MCPASPPQTMVGMSEHTVPGTASTPPATQPSLPGKRARWGAAAAGTVITLSLPVFWLAQILSAWGQADSCSDGASRCFAPEWLIWVPTGCGCLAAVIAFSWASVETPRARSRAATAAGVLYLAAVVALGIVTSW